jgi:hypothetical protein
MVAGLETQPAEVTPVEPSSADSSDQSAKGTPKQRKRLQIEMSEVAFQRLSELVDESGAESIAQFTRKAIQLYARVLEEKKAGFELYFSKGVKQVEVL